MQYKITLPTREVFIEMIAANEREGYWIEVGRGKTELAETVGIEIERSED